MLQRPPSSVFPVWNWRSKWRPVGSFWTTLTEEDEQRLFTEKLNKTFFEYLNLINEGWPKEEIWDTMNDLMKNVPDALKLVNYWISLAHADPLFWKYDLSQWEGHSGKNPAYWRNVTCTCRYSGKEESRKS